MQPKILIAGTSYVDNEHTKELVRLWYRVLRHQNPGEDFILIDAPSPFDPEKFLPIKSDEIFRFENNVGAITRGGGDGAGRGCCKAIEIADQRGYDYVAVYETDAIFCPPIRSVINRMHKAGVKVASPSLATPYRFAEWLILFINVKYAMETNFIAKYDWPNSPAWPLVEMRLERIFGDDLFFFNYPGMRNESNTLNIANLANHFPYGNCQWLTHCADLNVYTKMLEMNGIYPT